MQIERKKNLELSQKEKEYNKNHSKKRIIIIEHSICRLKKYRILADIFRNKLRKYNKILYIVTADLVNYRMINQNHY